jgi:hypothetical protein
VLDEPAEAPVNRLEIDHEATRIVSNLIEFRKSDRVLVYEDHSLGLAAGLAPHVQLVVGTCADEHSIDSDRGAVRPTGLNVEFELFSPAIAEVPSRSGTALGPSVEEFAATYSKHFDIIVSLRSFASFSSDAADRALRLFSDVLAPTGQVILGTRLRLSFAPTDNLTSDTMPVDSRRLFTSLADEGLRPVSLTFGTWRGYNAGRVKTPSEFDVVLVTRQPALPRNFSADRYLELHPDIAAANIDPVEHYMLYGFYEGRQTA